MIIKLIKISIAICLILNLVSTIGITAEAKDNNWNYSIQNGIEKTKRSYLLVYAPQTQQEKRISVVSKCSKPYMSEGTYGTCTHRITIQPTKKTFSIDTGEDVVIVNSSFDSLLLATVEYGCCAGLDIVRFYTERGTYLGRLSTMSPSKSKNNVITDMSDFKNSTRSDDNRYLVVQDERDDYKYYAWIKENKKEMIKIPILMSIPDKSNCDEWYLSDFTKYYDHADITLTVEGRFCEEQNRKFSCQKIEQNIKCNPVK